MKKQLFSFIIFTSLFSLPTFAEINSACDGTDTNPCIVQDTTTGPDHNVKHLRDAKMIANAYKGNTHGLKHLWISASGAPSQQDFATIADFVKKESNGQATKIIDLDLRQETHGYLNGEAVNLTDHYNWINFAKSYQQALADEMQWLNTLKISPLSQVYVLTPDEFKADEFGSGSNVNIKDVSSEETVATTAGFAYQRLTVTDHMAPRDEDVDKFVTIVRQMPQNTWLHLHCRGGDGRSTTFFAMFDMLKNADQVSFNDIIQRQAAIKPYYNLFNLENKDPTISPYYKLRLAFLRQFYQFSSDALRGYQGTWSDWKRDNLKKVMGK